MDITDLIASLGLSLAGCVGLQAFYKAFETTWPERYYDGVHGADPLVSRSSYRYAAFRIGPLLLALAVVGTTAHRLDLDRGFVAWTTTLAYASWGPGRRAIEALVHRPLMLGVAIHRFGTTFGLLLAGLLYGFVGGHLDRLVPNGKDTVLAAWIALFVFMFGRLSASVPARRPNIDELVRRGVLEIPDELMTLLDEADSGKAFRSVAIAENVNRPAWVRRFERLLLRRNGSYGLMQVHSKRPISDEESVSRFIKKHECFAGRQDWDADELEKLFRKHNPSEEFLSLATEVYWRVL